MEMSAPTKLPFSVLGDFAQSSATQPTGQFPAQFDVQPDDNYNQVHNQTATTFRTSGNSGVRGRRESVAVPIGVLEVPIGVWGSRRVETNSGQSERVEVFAEDTSHRDRVSARRRDPIVGQCGPGPAGCDCESQIGSDHALSHRQCPNLSKHKRLCRNRVHALCDGLLGGVRVARDFEAGGESGGGNAVGERGFLEQWICEGSGFCSCERRDRFAGCCAVGSD